MKEQHFGENKTKKLWNILTYDLDGAEVDRSAELGSWMEVEQSTEVGNGETWAVRLAREVGAFYGEPVELERMRDAV